MELQARFSTELEREKLVSTTQLGTWNAAALAHRASLGEAGGAKAWEARVRPLCQLGYASDMQ